MERFLSVSNQDREFYLILRLTFSFIFTAICCWAISHNLSEKWWDITVLLRMLLYETRQFLKHFCCLAFGKFHVR